MVLDQCLLGHGSISISEALLHSKQCYSLILFLIGDEINYQETRQLSNDNDLRSLNCTEGVSALSNCADPETWFDAVDSAVACDCCCGVRAEFNCGC